MIREKKKERLALQAQRERPSSALVTTFCSTAAYEVRRSRPEMVARAHAAMGQQPTGVEPMTSPLADDHTFFFFFFSLPSSFMENRELHNILCSLVAYRSPLSNRLRKHGHCHGAIAVSVPLTLSRNTRRRSESRTKEGKQRKKKFQRIILCFFPSMLAL